MFDREDIGAALIFAGAVTLVLLPLIERAQSGMAFIQFLERGMR